MADALFLHKHSEFSDLLRIVADAQRINPALVEKDYWIMHCLYGLQAQGFQFELKGGTSLSKGFGLIHRFSEDIDIRIAPPQEMAVKIGKNHDKPAHIASRAAFYDWLAPRIAIDGITEVRRDHGFDDEKMRSGGVRLSYTSHELAVEGLKQGILLELGFDDVAPNEARNISSWAYDFAVGKVPIIDNRAKGIACYHPGYTFVEKLQTISTKFRKQQADGTVPVNFMRHYYDVFCLLDCATVTDFIGTDAYHAHKTKRFGAADNPHIGENAAFRLSDPETRSIYERTYEGTASLYYREQPAFSTILARIAEHIDRL